MNTYFNKTILLAAFSLITTQVFSQAQKLDRYFERQHLSGKFNGNVLIVENKKVLLKKAYGYRDAQKKENLTLKDRFHIGSIAKEFDAVGIMLLVDQGKLNITDKVSLYLPELPAWADSMSVKNLLQYASGLPDVKWKTVKNDQDNWNDLINSQKLNFTPGTKYEYNNNNTFLRRRIIEKITGMPFKDFVRSVILKKAGVTDGLIDPDESVADLAKPFDNDFKKYSLVPPITGWTCLSLDGFYRWSQAINTYQVISENSTAILSIPFEAKAQTGLGSIIIKEGKVMEHTHDGIAIRYQALLQYDAKTRRTIILMTNQRQDNVYELAEAVNQILNTGKVQ